jgi:hypothetical protein
MNLPETYLRNSGLDFRMPYKNFFFRGKRDSRILMEMGTAAGWEVLYMTNKGLLQFKEVAYNNGQFTWGIGLLHGDKYR